MALFPSQTLRDLFQNNIDFVAKQVGVINDFLFGTSSDGSDTIQDMPYILHTYQAIYSNPEDFGINLSWNQIALASIDIDASGVTLQCNDSIRCSLGNVPEMAQVDSQVLPYLKTFGYHNSLPDMGIDRIKSTDRYLIGMNGENETDVNVTYNYANSVYTNKLYIKPNPPQSLLFENDTCYILGTASGFNGGIDHEFYISKLNDVNYPNNIVIMPSKDSYQVQNYIDNSTRYDITNNNQTIYNYYNDNGDLIINGGAFGGGLWVTPVTGLAFNDVKFILDSLVDELNVAFDFSSDGVAPLSYAPTLDEIRYGDYSSFYIEKLHQLKELPTAPDLADTVIDISEPLGILNDGFDGVFGAFDALGISLMVGFTFVARLCIRKLRGE